MDILESFSNKVNSLYAVDIDKEIVFDGSCHRFGKDKKIWAYPNTWQYNGKDYFSISFGSWSKGDRNVINSWNEELNRDKNFVKAFKKKTVEAKAKIELDQKKKNEACAKKWSVLWKKYSLCKNHAYLEYKKVKAYNLKLDHTGALVVPIYNLEGFVGVQRIYKNPETQKFDKRFSPGVKLKGSILPLKRIEKGCELIYLVEGYATGASVQMAFPDIPVVVAFNAGNLPNAIETIRAKHPEINICIAADNDDAGISKAKLCKKRYKNIAYRVAKFSVPTAGMCDFNDVHVMTDLDNVKRQLEIDGSEFMSIRALGYNENSYYYVSSENKQLVILSSENHKRLSFLRLIPDENYWYKNYGKEDDDGNLTGVDWNKASSDLMTKCTRKGLFDPKKVRGLGVWRDGKSYVINNGESVVNENKSSSFHYHKCVSVNYDFEYEDLSDLDALAGVFKSLKLKNKNDYFYISAFIIQQYVFSVLDWRFSVWVTGEAGSGKSTVLDWINKFSINSAYTDDASASGIIQNCESNAVNVIFDESEANQHLTEGVIHLNRKMSVNKGAKSLRGTPSGKGKEYNTQCSICFGSVQVPQLNQADRSRIFVVELVKDSGQNPEEFAAMCEVVNYFISIKNSLFTRAYESIDSIRYNTIFCQGLLRKKYKMDQRQADQLGGAMACYFVYFSQEKMNEQDFDKMINKLDLINSSYAENNEVTESQACYSDLMNVIIDNYQGISLSSVLDILQNDKGAIISYENRLSGFGLKYIDKDKSLFIANQNKNLDSKLKDYPAFRSILRRERSLIIKEKDRQRIGGSSPYGIRIKIN